MREERGVASPSRRKILDVVGKHVIEVAHPVAVCDPQLPRVAKVEDPHVPAHHLVLLARIAVMFRYFPIMIVPEPASPGRFQFMQRSSHNHSHHYYPSE